jgi:hypothetical protein
MSHEVLPLMNDGRHSTPGEEQQSIYSFTHSEFRDR